MCWWSSKILPYLAERFDITYVATGKEVPSANFKDVKTFPRWKHMMLAGFGLSKCIDHLYEEGKIDLAVVYASIGFAIRKTPFISMEGGSVYKEIRLFRSLTPWYRRPRFLVGFLHYALPEMLCVRRARHVVTNSETLRRDIISLHRIPPHRVSVTYNGVGQEYLDVYLKRQLSVHPRALYVGRLHFRKGILKVLEEFVTRPDIDTEFLVAGDGPDRPAVERLARGDRRIVYLGFIDRSRLLGLLSTSHVFVFPTYYEGFAASILEAMAAGLTCLSYESPVTREMLGDAGIMVPLGDAKAIVDRLDSVVKQPSCLYEYGKAAHARASQYSWDACAREMGRIIERELEAELGNSRRCE
jgi:glycosyltransferase involved in cell wall biosynthesis